MRALAFPVLILLVLPGLAREIRPDPAVAGAPAAAEILKACADKYAHCATYQDQGVVRARYEGKDLDHSDEKPFTTAFVRPDRFRFEFSSRDVVGKEDRYVVWQGGKEVKSWWSLVSRLESHPSLGEGLSGPTGVSGGSAYTVPATLVADAAWKGEAWTAMKDAYRIEDAAQEGSPCYRIQRLTSSPARKVHDHELPATRGKETLWVRRSDHLLVRIDQETDFGTFFVRQTTTYAPRMDAPVAPAALAFGH